MLTLPLKAREINALLANFIREAAARAVTDQGTEREMHSESELRQSKRSVDVETPLNL